jgi:hypothetical protein
MGFLYQRTGSASPDSSDGRSLSGSDSRSDFLSFAPWVVFLFLLACSTYYLSRPDPAELQDRAMRVMGDLKHLQEQKADAQALNLLLTQLEQEENRNFTRGIWQHVSHALFVACFLILAVEVHTRRVARKDMQRHIDNVTKNVFQGVSQRLLGEAISSELRSLLREDFVKAKAGYQLTFEGTPGGADSDWVIVRQESWYDVRNLTREAEDFPFRTSLLGYHKRTVTVDGAQKIYPHFVSVTIDDKEWTAKDLKEAENPDSFTLQKKIPFTNEVLSVKVVARLLYRTKDSVVLSSAYGMEQSEITVSNEAANLVGKCEAVVLHKHTEQVKPRTSGRWEFNRALLPGQGWYVYWENRESGHTPSNREGHAEDSTRTETKTPTLPLGDDHAITNRHDDSGAHVEPPTTTTV